LVEIEFVVDFCCFQKSQRKYVQPGFAQIMVEEGKARYVEKAMKGPVQNKMVSEPKGMK